MPYRDFRAHSLQVSPPGSGWVPSRSLLCGCCGNHAFAEEDPARVAALAKEEVACGCMVLVAWSEAELRCGYRGAHWRRALRSAPCWAAEGQLMYFGAAWSAYWQGRLSGLLMLFGHFTMRWGAVCADDFLLLLPCDVCSGCLSHGTRCGWGHASAMSLTGDPWVCLILGTMLLRPLRVRRVSWLADLGDASGAGPAAFPRAFIPRAALPHARTAALLIGAARGTVEAA